MLCRVVVVETLPHSAGLVRTVVVESRLRDSREPSLAFNPKKLVREKLPVQRKALICPAEDIPQPKSVQDVNIDA